MITKETCVQIWNAHNEIENSRLLIKNMAKIVSEDKEKRAPTLTDAFGDRRGLQLGVPTGNNGHNLYNVSVELAVKVIEQHIEMNQLRLTELMAIVKIELSA